MKRISFYIVFPVFILMTASCDDFLEKLDDHYHEIPGYMYPELQLADTFVYTCVQTEVLDTFIVTRCELYKEIDGNSTYELYKIELTPYQNNELLDDIFYITNHWAGVSVTNNKNSLGFSVVDGWPNYTTEKEDLRINGVRYRDVRTITSENSKTKDSLIYRLWYNFDYSIVKYEMGNEMTHELLKKPF